MLNVLLLMSETKALHSCHMLLYHLAVWTLQIDVQRGVKPLKHARLEWILK